MYSNTPSAALMLTAIMIDMLILSAIMHPILVVELEQPDMVLTQSWIQPRQPACALTQPKIQLKQPACALTQPASRLFPLQAPSPPARNFGLEDDRTSSRNSNFGLADDLCSFAAEDAFIRPPIPFLPHR